MQPILLTADPLPFKSHPCPLHCLQTAAGERELLYLEMKLKFSLTLNRLDEQLVGELYFEDKSLN